MCYRNRHRLVLATALLLFLNYAAAHAFQSLQQVVRVTKVIQPDFAEAQQRIPNLFPHRVLKRPTVALVLSGGGARGVAAIGVLREFERANIPIDFIVGTSMGGIVGGLYAAGYQPDQLQRLVDTTNWSELLSFSDKAPRSDLFFDQKIAEDRSILTVRFQGLEPILPSALSTGQRITNYFNLLTLQGIYHPNPSFDDLRIPFRTLATDLVSGKQVVIDRGDLTEAMRASITVPLLYTPVIKDTLQLVDGGLIANIPVDVARAWGADLIVAVDVTSPLRPREHLSALWEKADQIVGIMMQLSNEQQRERADIVIQPELGNHLSSDFTDLDTLIARGERAAKSAIQELQSRIIENTYRDFGRNNVPEVFANPRLEFDSTQLDQLSATRLRALAQQPEVAEHEAKQLVTEMYASGDFKTAEIHIAPAGDQTLMQLHVEFNPVLTSVEISGNHHVSIDSLQAVFRLLLGRRINIHRSRRAIEELLGIYRDAGYSLARIKGISFDDATGRARIDLDEGVVHRYEIQGTRKTKDYVIWREWPFDEGEVFNVAKVARGMTNLYGTYLFEHISVSVRQEAESQVVTIYVRERSTELIRAGLRIDSERNVQPSLDMRDENFLGIGAELGVRIGGGERNRLAMAEFKATRIFNSYFTFGLKGCYSFRDVNVFGDEQLSDPAKWDRIRVGEYRELRQGGTMTFGTQLERLGTVTAEGRLESQRVWSIFNKPLDTESFRIASLKLGLKLDTQDQFPFPRSGLLMNFFYESAGDRPLEPLE